jgi:hypothetical protein
MESESVEYTAWHLLLQVALGIYIDVRWFCGLLAPQPGLDPDCVLL